MLRKTMLILLALTFVCSVSAFAGTIPPYTPDKVYYVDAASTATTPDGTTWALAYTKISDAVTFITGAGGVAPTASWGHIIMVKPGAYSDNIVLNHAKLVGLKIMSSDLSSWPVVTGTTTAAELAIGAAVNRVLIKGIKFKAVTGQTTAIVTTAATAIDYRFVNCYFDLNAITTITTGVVEVTPAQAHSAAMVQFENCTINMNYIGAADALIGISLLMGGEINDFTVLGCTFIGNSAKVASAANATVAFQNAPATLFGKNGAGVNLLGNTFRYAKVVIQTAAAAGDNNDKLKILGNYFELTDGVHILASGHAATQFTNQANISYNHFNLNYTGATIPFAIRLEADIESIPAAKYTITYNHIERTQVAAAGGDATAHVRTALYTGGTTGYGVDAINRVPQDYNYWGSAAGTQTAAGNAAVGAYADAGIAVRTTSDYLVTGTFFKAPILDLANGIQFFDVDNDGHIDKAVIFMKNPVVGQVGNSPVDPASLPLVANDGLSLGSAYEISSVHLDTKLDATGFAVAVYLKEMADFDTGVQPDIIFSAANNITSHFAGLTHLSDQYIASWNEGNNRKVDKAPPILVMAQTSDTGIGGGSGSNGKLDGIRFTFSELVQGVRAADTWENTSYAGGNTADPDSNLAVTVGDLSFNQGSANRTPFTSVYTLPVYEASLNTGLAPTVVYKVRATTSGPGLEVIADFAKTAAGADSWNSLYVAGAASLTINVLDNAPLVVASVQTADSTPDGKIDKITVTFSENVKQTSSIFTSSAGVKFVETNPLFGSGPQPQGEYTIFSFTVNGPVVEFVLTINGVATTFDTEAKPEFRYTRSTTVAQEIMDIAGVQLANYGSDKAGALHPATDDKAKPFVYKIETMDAYTDTCLTGGTAFASAGANGRIDAIKLYFSENVNTANGAANGGTALDSAIAQFALTHSLTSATLSKVPAVTAVIGKPTLALDTSTDQTGILTITFLEQSHVAAGLVATNGGDTGAGVTAVYGALAALDQLKDSSGNLIYTIMPTTTDKAAPFVVQGIGKNWYTGAFSNIRTVDSSGLTNSAGKIAKNELLDYGDGDGYVDGFEIKFTEAVLIPAAATADSVKKFTTTLTGGGKLTLNAISPANIATVAASTIIVTGTADKAGLPDTGTTPALSLGTLWVKDTGLNVVVPFLSKPVSDGCKPVMVSVLQNGPAATANQMKITFSEPVYLYYASSTTNAPVDSVNTSSNVLFSYNDTATGGASTASPTFVKSVTGLKGDKQWIVALDGYLSAADIASSSVWIKGSGIYDDANAVETGLLDNQAEYALAGTNANGDIKIRIMDDVVSPFVLGAETIDADGNGYIDHIKLTLNEGVKDTTITGYVRQNTMSGNVIANFVISGYTGTTVLINCFNDNDAGKEAAAAALKPVFYLNMANDAALYLEIEESGLTSYLATGLGTTGYTGTLGFGTVTPTLTDMSDRENVLDITFGTVKTAEKGKIVDKVGPVLMKAEWANSKIYLAFSEAVADTVGPYKCVDFEVFDMYNWGFDSTPASDAGAATWAVKTAVTSKTLALFNYRSQIGGLLWTSPGVMELTMVSGWTPPIDKKLGIQLSRSTAQSGDNTTAGVFQDAAVTAAAAAAPNVSTKYIQDPAGTATWYTVGNKACPYPYITVPAKDYLGLVQIVGFKNLKLTSMTSATPIMAGVTSDVKWSYVNITNVDVFKSTDNGATYSKIATVAASAGKYTWTAEAGVDYLKIMGADAAADSIYFGKTGLITVSVDEYAPVVAPTTLTVTDVPGDNGRWFYAKFKASTSPTVNSYQFYRWDKKPEAADTTWVYFAIIPKTVAAANGFNYVMVPTPKNGVFKYTVVASTGTLLSSYSAKEAEIPVAMLVDEAAAKAAAVINSDYSDYALGGAIDNIAPSPVTNAVAVNNDGAGIKVTWTNPADHDVVGWIKISDVQIPIYGAEAYNVYRKVSGTDTYVLAGTAGLAATSFIDDKVPNGSTIYEYKVLATDFTNEVATTVPGKAMASKGADFNGDTSVGLGDLVLLGNLWGVKSTDATYLVNYDLNKDGSIGLGDLVLLGNVWGSKVAKIAPASGVSLDMTAQVNEATSMYYVNVSAKDALDGMAFTLNYDANLFEFVKESVTGLGVVSIANETKAGVIDIGSAYVNEKFSGAITLGFKSKGRNSDMNVEMLNAEVVINDVIGSVDGKAVTLKALPTVYALAQNFPNPFNPTTTIEYSVPTSGHTSLAIYNLAGQKVRTLVNETKAPSFYKVVWDGKNESGMTVATGTYFYKLVSGNYSKIVKMTLIK